MANSKIKMVTLELQPDLYAHLLERQYKESLENIKNGGKKITLRQAILQCLNDYLLGEN